MIWIVPAAPPNGGGVNYGHRNLQFHMPLFVAPQLTVSLPGEEYCLHIEGRRLRGSQ